MLSSERQRLIKEESLRKGEISIPELAKKYGVSVETIRRDVNILTEKNFLTKVHGGAIPKRPTIREDDYSVRSVKNLAEKNAIGEYIAAVFIKDNDRIALASGSTAEIIAGKITGINLTVVTNSISAAGILQARISQNLLTGDVVLLGGRISPDNRYTGGIVTIEMLKKFTFSKAILCASAIDSGECMSSDMDEGIIMMEMIKRSQYSCVAADASKIGLRSTFAFARFSEVDLLVTNAGADLSHKKGDCEIVKVG